jgi:hypothetical protein
LKVIGLLESTKLMLHHQIIQANENAQGPADSPV